MRAIDGSSSIVSMPTVQREAARARAACVPRARAGTQQARRSARRAGPRSRAYERCTPCTAAERASAVGSWADAGARVGADARIGLAARTSMGFWSPGAPRGPRSSQRALRGVEREEAQVGPSRMPLGFVSKRPRRASMRRTGHAATLGRETMTCPLPRGGQEALERLERVGACARARRRAAAVEALALERPRDGGLVLEVDVEHLVERPRRARDGPGRARARHDRAPRARAKLRRFGRCRSPRRAPGGAGRAADTARRCALRRRRAGRSRRPQARGDPTSFARRPAIGRGG
jgi:hypothetical protein